MDYDALRRGQRTVNVVFDAATSSLAGDALQSLACATLAQASCDAEAGMAMLRELATAAGSRGMCGGQALDIDATGAVSPLHVEELERLHALKTGALLRASVRMGAIAAGGDADTPDCLDRLTAPPPRAFPVSAHPPPIPKP